MSTQTGVEDRNRPWFEIRFDCSAFSSKQTLFWTYMCVWLYSQARMYIHRKGLLYLFVWETQIHKLMLTRERGGLLAFSTRDLNWWYCRESKGTRGCVESRREHWGFDRKTPLCARDSWRDKLVLSASPQRCGWTHCLPVVQRISMCIMYGVDRVCVHLYIWSHLVCCASRHS